MMMAICVLLLLLCYPRKAFSSFDEEIIEIFIRISLIPIANEWSE